MGDEIADSAALSLLQMLAEELLVLLVSRRASSPGAVVDPGDRMPPWT